MKRLYCACGQRVYFDNHRCANCNRGLAFDPTTLTMLAETEAGAGLQFCSNRSGHSRCNWIAAPQAHNGVCLSCSTSKIIPDLSKTANHERWRKLEVAKRRLIYGLLRLGLPFDAFQLRFVFKEDRRTNPLMHDAHVNTGYSQGVITINAAEADDVFREQMRVEMNEPYRTLLGHFRHESGHFYFRVLIDDERLAAARELFGDERLDYAQAIDRHYQNGPPADWPQQYVSAYASMHPSEDWAECWAHYLHLRSVLETAAEQGWPISAEPGNWHEEFIQLMLSVNELMRSLGLPDAYPFVLTVPIVAKLEFIHRAVSRYRSDATS